MSTRFRHAALVGKFNSGGIREELGSIAKFLVARGLSVSIEAETARNTGIDAWPALDAEALGAACDIAVVLGGDGTMLGIARRLARHGTPLVGINQGRLGFITDIAFGGYEPRSPPSSKASTTKSSGRCSRATSSATAPASSMASPSTT
jgi:NAD+ kinase